MRLGLVLGRWCWRLARCSCLLGYLLGMVALQLLGLGRCASMR
jgi:hypothetical protein